MKRLLLTCAAPLIALVQLAIILGFAAYYLPLSLIPFREQTAKLIEEKTGLQLEWLDGGLSWREGRCEVRELSCRLSDSPGDSFTFQKAVIHFSSADTGAKRDWSIERIEFFGPDPLLLILDDDGLAFQPSITKFFTQLKSGSNRTSSGLIRPPRVTLSDFSASLVRRREGTQVSLLFALAEMQLSLDFQPNGSWALTWDGLIEDRGLAFPSRRSAISGAWRAEPGTANGYLAIEAERLLLPLDAGQQAAEPLNLLLDQPELAGQLHFENGLLSFDGRLSAQRAQLEDGPAAFTLEEVLPVIELSVTGNLADRSINWRNLRFHSAAADFVSTGGLRLEDGLLLEGLARWTRLNPRWLEVARGQLGWPEFQVDLEEGGAISFEGLGRMGNDAKPPLISGVLTVDGLRLNAPGLPRPLRQLAGVVRFSEELLECPSLTGLLGESAFSLEAESSPTLLAGKAGLAQVAIRADLDLGDLTAGVDRVTENLLTSEGIELSGKAHTSGTIQLSWPDQPKIADFKLEANGLVEITDARVAHPNLPAPIERINGLLSGSNERLDISNLAGKVLGADVQIGGELTGQGLFWLEPELALVVTVLDVDLGELVETERFPELQSLKRFAPEGQASLTVALGGPAYRPREWRIDSWLTLSNGAFDPQAPWTPARVTALNARLRLQNGAALIEEADFLLGDIPLTLSGSLRRERLELTLSCAAVGLKNIREAFPRVLGGFYMDGDTEGFLQLTLTNKEAEATTAMLATGDLERVWLGLLDDFSRSPSPYESHLSGRFSSDNATFSPIVCPELAHNIKCVVEINDNLLTFKNVAVDLGAAANCTISGEVLLRGANWPKISLWVQAPELTLDNWIRGWNIEEERRQRALLLGPDQPLKLDRPSTAPQRQMELRLEMDADLVHWRQYEGTALSGNLSYTGTEGVGGELLIQEVRATAYQGQLGMTVTAAFPDHQPAVYEYVFQPQRIDLPSFLSAMRGQEDRTEGLLSGKLRIAGVGGEADSLNGEGQLIVEDSRFVGNIILKELSRVVPLIGDLRFTTIESPVEIRDRKIIFDNLVFKMPLMRVTAKGSCGFDRALDFDLSIEFYEEPEIRIVGLRQVLDVVRSLRETILDFHLGGTLEQPKLSYRLPLHREQELLLEQLQKAWELIPAKKFLDLFKKKPPRKEKK